MDRTVPQIEWKAQETTGNLWKARPSPDDPPAQRPLGAQLAEVRPMAMLDEQLLARVSYDGALAEAMRSSGKDDWEVADEIHISHGYMSKFLRGQCRQWARRLVAFCRATRNLAPVQIIAHELGCGLVPRAPQLARIRELQAELAQLQGRAA